jgi:hypothetical protein
MQVLRFLAYLWCLKGASPPLLSLCRLNMYTIPPEIGIGQNPGPGDPFLIPVLSRSGPDYYAMKLRNELLPQMNLSRESDKSRAQQLLKLSLTLLIAGRSSFLAHGWVVDRLIPPIDCRYLKADTYGTLCSVQHKGEVHPVSRYTRQLCIHLTIRIDEHTAVLVCTSDTGFVCFAGTFERRRNSWPGGYV